MLLKIDCFFIVGVVLKLPITPEGFVQDACVAPAAGILHKTLVVRCYSFSKITVYSYDSKNLDKHF
jgi:hypothetical protein